MWESMVTTGVKKLSETGEHKWRGGENILWGVNVIMVLHKCKGYETSPLSLPPLPARNILTSVFRETLAQSPSNDFNFSTVILSTGAE